MIEHAAGEYIVYFDPKREHPVVVTYASALQRRYSGALMSMDVETACALCAAIRAVLDGEVKADV